MATLLRPIKLGNVRTYVEEVAAGFDDILADEVDADLNTLYDDRNILIGTDRIAPGAITNLLLAGNAVANQNIQALSVDDAKISGVAWSKISGVPAGLPPAGAAGGDLVGSTYPAPVVAAGKITRQKTAPDLWLPPIPATGTADVGKILAVGAGPLLQWIPAPAIGSGGGGGPPSGAAGGDLGSFYPDPSVLKASADFAVAGKLSVAGVALFGTPTVQTEAINVAGAIVLGGAAGANPGTIQYVNGGFEGYTALGWRSLDGVTRTALGQWTWLVPWSGSDPLLQGQVAAYPDAVTGTQVYLNVLNVAGVDRTSVLTSLIPGDVVTFDDGLGNTITYTLTSQVALTATGSGTAAYFSFTTGAVIGNPPANARADGLTVAHGASTTPIWRDDGTTIQPYAGPRSLWLGDEGQNLSFASAVDGVNGYPYMRGWNESLQVFGGSNGVWLYTRFTGNAVWITDTANMVVGTASGVNLHGYERLEVNGGITLLPALTTNEGTIQYAGGKFQGHDATGWHDLGGGGGALTVIGSTPPPAPQVGQLWWRDTDGNLYIYYDDGTSQQWVPAMASVGKLIGGQFYLLSGAVGGVPSPNLSVGYYVAALAFTLPQTLTGSQAVSKVAATAQTDFTVNVNGTAKGTIRFPSGQSTAVFVWAADVAVAVGDRIEVVAPGTADATLSDPAWTLRGAL